MATETQAPSVPMVTLTIDGREVRVPKGTNLIEAARKVGISIPYLCYHHQLTPFGGCRLCLVEVEKVPKLLAACNTLAADGMVVRTTTERVRSQRQATMEFILLNHPLDCPVCDKGGECELQDRTYEWSDGLSRMTEPKVHVEDYDLGPLIVRNQDRCIICKRCIKVMEEIVGEPVLEFGQRGVTTEVYTFEHEPFPAGFSGNTIRVCPVGALMSKPFRFKARPWELIKTPSLCSLCSVGCNLREDVRENRLLRVVGIENPQVNDGWLCDRGQFGYDYVHSPNRLDAPMIRRESGELERVSWDEAIAFVAERLRAIRDQHGGAAFGAIGSERISNEDAFVLQEFVRKVMRSPNVDHRMGSSRTGYAALRPRPGAIVDLPKADVVLLIGTDLTADAPVLDLVLKRGLLRKTMKLIVAHPRPTGLGKFAHRWLQHAPGQETALLHALCRALLDDGLVPDAVRQEQGGAVDALARSLPPLTQLAERAGVPTDAVREAARLLAGAKLASVLFGQAPADAAGGEAFLAAVRNLTLLSGQAGKPGHVLMEAVRQMNTWGARDLGLLPDSGPGGEPVERGLTTGEMLTAAIDGQLRALLVVGSNPAVEYPGAARARKALESVEFLVVQDLFLTETARLAHVVLPSVTVAERNCTLTNVEGRVQRAVRGLDPRGAAKEDWATLERIAEAMGEPLGYSRVEDVVRAIRERLARAPEAPPAPSLQPAVLPPVRPADADHPMRLYTGHLMFDRSTLQRESAVLPGLAPDPFVEIHPTDAARLGVADGERVAVLTPFGRLEVAARVTADTPAGSVFVPAGYNEAPVTALLVEGADGAPCRIGRADESGPEPPEA